MANTTVHGWLLIGLFVALPQLAEQFETVLLWQVEIEQDDVGQQRASHV